MKFRLNWWLQFNKIQLKKYIQTSNIVFSVETKREREKETGQLNNNQSAAHHNH